MNENLGENLSKKSLFYNEKKCNNEKCVNSQFKNNFFFFVTETIINISGEIYQKSLFYTRHFTNMESVLALDLKKNIFNTSGIEGICLQKNICFATNNFPFDSTACGI